jgi:hypothetical protein
MKQTKSILLAAIAAVAVGSASAQTTNVVARNQINLAGSTAFRAVHLRELHNWATTAGANQGYALQASDGSNPGSGSSSTCGTAALYSKLISTTTVRGVVTETRDFINARFVGSEGGTLLAGSKNTQGFYGLRQRGVGDSPTSTCTNMMSATITYSDCDQAVGPFSGFKGARAKSARLISAGNMAALNFIFFTTRNFPVDNITTRQAQALYQRGHLPLSFFTGNPADNTNGVFATGRNIDSGTRTAILTEIGHGSLRPVNQYDYNVASNSVFITPAGTLPGITFNPGDGGETSGSALATKIGAATNVTGANVVGVTNYTGNVYLIGYSGVGDVNATNSYASNLKALTYNGVPAFTSTVRVPNLQNATNGIANGSYSLFSIGKVYFNAANAPKGTDRALIPTIAQVLANNIATNTTSTFGNGNTAFSSLNITRAVEGTVAQPR